VAWNLLASTTVGFGFGGGTSSAINTTGANLIVGQVTSYSGAGTFTDSQGNTWQSVYVGGVNTGDEYCQILYAFAPTTSASHTFTTNGEYSVINVLAFSGSVGSGSYDQRNQNVPGVATINALGSITPSANNSMIIAALSGDNAIGANSINNGTIIGTDGNGINGAGFIAYYNQATAAAINETWSWTNPVSTAGIVASFLSGSGGGGGGVPFLAPPFGLVQSMGLRGALGALAGRAILRNPTITRRGLVTGRVLLKDYTK
jgi:hypothetical protein